MRSETHFFYMSFADGNLPEGSQWLGGCYVTASDTTAALVKSHKLGINPGGEVQMIGPLPISLLNMEAANKLLKTKEEVNAAVLASGNPST